MWPVATYILANRHKPKTSRQVGWGCLKSIVCSFNSGFVYRDAMIVCTFVCVQTHICTTHCICGNFNGIFFLFLKTKKEKRRASRLANTTFLTLIVSHSQSSVVLSSFEFTWNWCSCWNIVTKSQHFGAVCRTQLNYAAWNLAYFKIVQDFLSFFLLAITFSFGI